MQASVTSFLYIMVVAVLAPLITDGIHRVRVPVVVVEIMLGIVIGPQVLGLASVDSVVNIFSQLGLAFLFFLAGFEIDFENIRGRPLRLALVGWIVSLALAFAISGGLRLSGLTQSVEYVALAMATTSVGTLLPILRDAGEMETLFGVFFLALGAVGEFGPIVLNALVLNQERRFAVNEAVLDAFVVVVIVAVLVARRWRPPRVSRLVRDTMRSSAQLAVRLSILLLLAFTFLSAELGLDSLLGSFGAGIVVAQVVKTVEASDPEDVEALRIKYEGIGFGIFIPIFFVVSGIEFDLKALFTSVESVLLVPLFLLCFLIVRGAPVPLLYRKDLDAATRRPLALLSATELPLVIIITTIGVNNHVLSAQIAADMVGAAMLSVLLFPATAMALRARQRERPASPG